MDFAEATTNAFIHLRYGRFAVFVRLDNFLRAKCHADTTGFTPVMVKRNIVLFLFLRCCSPAFLCTGSFFCGALFSHCVPQITANVRKSGTWVLSPVRSLFFNSRITFNTKKKQEKPNFFSLFVEHMLE